MLSRRRLHRLGTTFVVLLSLLFAQLAVAAYACPGALQAGAACAGMVDAEQPALCHQQAADHAQGFEAAKLPALTQAALIHVIELPPVPEPQALSQPPATADAEAQAPPDPLFLSTLRLRV